MCGHRLTWFAGVLLAAATAGCGGASTATSPSPSGPTQPASQTAAPPTAQIVFGGGVTGRLDLNASASQCSLLPSGGFSGQFDGVLPGTTAALSIQVPTGPHPILVASDSVNLDTSADDWSSAVSGTVTVTVTGMTAMGSVNAIVAGTANNMAGSVPNLDVSGTFTCSVSRSSG
jgi:hypothetical protein